MSSSSHEEWTSVGRVVDFDPPDLRTRIGPERMQGRLFAAPVGTPTPSELPPRITGVGFCSGPFPEHPAATGGSSPSTPTSRSRTRLPRG